MCMLVVKSQRLFVFEKYRYSIEKQVKKLLIKKLLENLELHNSKFKFFT